MELWKNEVKEKSFLRALVFKHPQCLGVLLKKKTALSLTLCTKIHVHFLVK